MMHDLQIKDFWGWRGYLQTEVLQFKERVFYCKILKMQWYSDRKHRIYVRVRNLMVSEKLKLQTKMSR